MGEKMRRRAAAADEVMRHRTHGEEPGLGDIALRWQHKNDTEKIGMSARLIPVRGEAERVGKDDGGRDGHVELTPSLPRSSPSLPQVKLHSPDLRVEHPNRSSRIQDKHLRIVCSPNTQNWAERSARSYDQILSSRLRPVRTRPSFPPYRARGRGQRED